MLTVPPQTKTPRRKYLVLLLCVAALSGCGRRGGSPDTFRINMSSGLNTLDPAQMSSLGAREAGMQIFDGLVKTDPHGAIVPDIAEHWETPDSGTTWLFTLRSGVRFQDDGCFPGGKGRFVTARDFLYSFTRICNPRTRSTGWWIFHNRVAGADEFHDGAANADPQAHPSGFDAPNDSIFVIRLTKPFAPFLSILAMPYCFVVPREAVEKYGDDFFQHPVGTGAFSLDSWKPDVLLSLTRNPNYTLYDSGEDPNDKRGEATGNIKTIAISFVRDVKTEFLSFTNGDLDAVAEIPAGFENAVFDEHGNLLGDYRKYSYFWLPSCTSEYYGILLDTTEDAGKDSPLAKNRDLRRALNYAIDRDAIIRYVLHGQATAAHGILPQGMKGYDTALTASDYTYDPAKARALLAQAGYPDGKNLPALTLQLGEDEQTASVAEAVQQQWKQIGIQLNLRQVDFPQHLAMVREGKLPLWRAQWVADYSDAENFCALMYGSDFSPSGPNTTHYASAAFDSLYERSTLAAIGADERLALYRRMDSIATADAPWIFLYYPKIIRLLQPGISGFASDPMGYYRICGIMKVLSKN